MGSSLRILKCHLKYLDMSIAMSPEDIIREAAQYFIGVQLFDGYRGHSMFLDEADVVLLFSEADGGALLGVRFPSPVLPKEGIAYRGVMMRTPRDWILDIRVVLMDELGTGLALKGQRTVRPGWTELTIPADNWTITDSHFIEEWADPDTQ